MLVECNGSSFVRWIENVVFWYGHSGLLSDTNEISIGHYRKDDVSKEVVRKAAVARDTLVREGIAISTSTKSNSSVRPKSTRTKSQN